MSIDRNYSAWIEAVPNIVWVASKTGSVTFLNRRWTQMTGLGNDRGLGFEFFQAIHPEDRDRVRTAWQEAVRSECPYEAKFRLRLANGAYCRIIARAQLEPTSDLSDAPQNLDWVGTFTDIESVVYCKDDLILKQQFLEALLNNLSDGIVACDATGTLTLFNAASQAFHGLPAQPLPSDRWADYYDLYEAEGSLPLAQENIPLVRALKGERVQGAKMRIVPKSGKPRVLIANGAPILHPDGHQLGAVVAMRDVTAQEEAESELHQLNALLEQRVAERTAQLEVKNYQNELLLASEQEAKSELEAVVAQLETLNCQKEELLEREQAAKAELEIAIAETANYTERLTLALDAAQMGTWDFDMVTEHILWNPRHEIVFGYSPGTPNRDYFDWERRVHPEDLEWVHQATHAARDTQQILTLQYRIIWPDGSLHWIDAKGRFFYDSSNRPIRMIGVVRDITARKQAEEALYQTQAQFRATFEQAAVGIAHVALDGHWLRVNQKLCNILGYSAEELQNLTFQDLTHPDDLEANLACIQQLLAGEIQTYSMEKRYFHKSGEVVWIEITVALVRAEAEAGQSSFQNNMGAPQYFISVIEEINDRKQDRAELQARALELSNLNGLLAQAAVLLEERNQELDRFVHIVSHDLKAPLRAIYSLSQWIEEDIEGELSLENQQQMQLLRDRVRRMETLISGLLDYAKAGRTDAEIETVSVAELLAEVVDSLAPPRSFQIEVMSAMPTLITKRLLLSQVFSNLIGNAIKHHDRPDGFVRISSQDKGDFYEFSVADDGPGIESKYHDQIFMIFQTINTRNNPDSSGIGLSIVKKIVETEEGTIRLESELGKGTTFYFTWPKQSLSLD